MRFWTRDQRLLTRELAARESHVMSRESNHTARRKAPDMTTGKKRTLKHILGIIALSYFGCASLFAAPQKYRDGRPAATLRMDAKDHGSVLRYGDGPDTCDYLGARDVWVFERITTCTGRSNFVRHLTRTRRSYSGLSQRRMDWFTSTRCPPVTWRSRNERNERNERNRR